MTSFFSLVWLADSEHCSGALSVKMSVFLYFPGLLVILVKSRGVFAALRYVMIIALTQVIFALPFLENHWHSYLQQAFDLSRVFLYKWTVNWRFLNENTFLSRGFATGLLIGHVSVLVAFGWFRWCRKDGGVVKVIDRGLRRPSLPASLVPISGDGQSRVDRPELFPNVPQKSQLFYSRLI